MRPCAAGLLGGGYAGHGGGAEYVAGQDWMDHLLEWWRIVLVCCVVD